MLETLCLIERNAKLTRRPARFASNSSLQKAPLLSKLCRSGGLALAASFVLAIRCLAGGIPSHTPGHSPPGDAHAKSEIRWQPAPARSSDYLSVVERAAESSYFLRITSRTESQDFLKISNGRASAVAVDVTPSECILLTSAHALKGAGTIDVTPWRAVSAPGAVPSKPAKVLWIGTDVDAALLAIPFDGACHPTAGERENPALGEHLISLGQPRDMRGLLTEGSIGNFWTIRDRGMLIASDMPIHPGTSGAGVFSADDGALVGIAYGTAAADGDVEAESDGRFAGSDRISLIMPISRILAKLPFKLGTKSKMLADASSAHRELLPAAPENLRGAPSPDANPPTPNHAVHLFAESNPGPKNAPVALPQAAGRREVHSVSPSLSEADTLVAAVASSYGTRNWQSVIDTATAALRIQKSDSRVLVERAVAYVMTNNIGAAIEDADSAIALSPEMPDAYHAKGMAVGSEGKTQEAEALDKKACQLGMVSVCTK